MANVSFKQGEAKTLTLTVKDNGAGVDLSAATIFLGVKKKKTDASFIIEKQDADFDKSQAAAGVISVFLSDADLSVDPGHYIGELKATFPDSTIDKSADLSFRVEQAVT
ncbi:MAG: BppU family phage baseplate upper protein [Deltaproteobacteria bacterium]|nr:BppU family phage baseplate upper protein [Deltaproteobacteria bacterium]